MFQLHSYLTHSIKRNKLSDSIYQALGQTFTTTHWIGAAMSTAMEIAAASDERENPSTPDTV